MRKGTIRLVGEETEVAKRAAALVGTTLSDRYRIDAVIHASKAGATFRAEHVPMRVVVALKVLYPGAAPDLELRFEREAIVGAHVRHANVAVATDSGAIADGSRYLATEYVAGGTLAGALANGPMPEARAVAIARQMASALEAIHAAGAVHRDVEPRNVLLSGSTGDTVKLVDFGSAKIDLERAGAGGDRPASAKALTALGEAIGTPAYRAPEGAVGGAAMDERSDLYSLGVVMYEMLAGKRPFDAGDPTELLTIQTTSAPPAIAERVPGVSVSPALEVVVMRLLRRAAKDRYATAREALDALEDLASQPSAAAIKPAARAAGAPSSRSSLSASLQAWRSRLARALDAADRFWRRRVGDRWPRWGTIAALALVPGVLSGVIVLALTKRAPQPGDVDPDRTSHVLAASAGPVASSGSAAQDVGRTIDGMDAAACRARLSSAAQTQDWMRAAQAVEALAQLEPAAFHEPAVASATVAVAVTVETVGGPHADGVFEALSRRLGTDGLDILFEIVRTRGATRGAKRAATLLEDESVMARATPALRIGFDLRRASCDQKAALFDRAVAEGDRRALTELQILRGAECERDQGSCCFREDQALGEAIKRLKERLDAR